MGNLDIENSAIQAKKLNTAEKLIDHKQDRLAVYLLLSFSILRFPIATAAPISVDVRIFTQEKHFYRAIYIDRNRKFIPPKIFSPNFNAVIHSKIVEKHKLLQKEERERQNEL